MQNLNVALIQSELIWEAPQQNRQHFEALFTQKILPNTHLVVLPEMFTTGFTMKSVELAETMRGDTIEWMKQMAARYKFALAGSLIISENNTWFNRLVFVQPDGKIQYYNKRHLFAMGDEHKFFKAGDQQVIIDYKGWKILPLVCYDLRFPVWIRNQHAYDCALVVANWPAARSDQWEIMIKSRAIENQSYMLAVNRVGKDGNGLNYNGNSMAVSPLGRVLGHVVDDEAVIYVELSKDKLQKARSKMPFLKDRDSFQIQF